MNQEILDSLRSNGRATWNSTADFSVQKLKRLPSVWATEERRIPSGTSPVSGGRDIRYDHRMMPHCVEQMDSADDPSIQTIVIWGAIRDGKTSGVCVNIIGRTVTDDPGGIYSVHPIADDAEKFSQDDIEPTIEATPALKNRFVTAKSRDSGRTIENKKFIGGGLRILGSNSITKFRGTAVKVLMLHELDKLNIEAIYAAFGRQTGFKDAVRVLESTCTYSSTVDPETGKKIYRSRIEEWYDKGDKRKWFCPCRKCGRLQVILFENIRHSKGEPEKAVVHCEACDADHNEAQWRKMVLAGRWYPTAGLTAEQQIDIVANYRSARAKEPQVRSYWRNGFCNLFPHGKGFKTKLHQFVAEAESAKSSREALEKWETEVAARTWNPDIEGEAPPAWKPIFDLREDYGLVIPMRGLFLTSFVDVQYNRLEVGWRAWGRQEESWGMDHVVLDGHYESPEVWNALRFELARKFKHESGAEIGMGLGYVDAGFGGHADAILAFFRKLAQKTMLGVTGYFRASKGTGDGPVVQKRHALHRNGLMGMGIGTWAAKDRIYERLRLGEAEKMPENIRREGASEVQTASTNEGRMHFNQRFSEEYFTQLTAETVTITWERGKEIRKYINPGMARNEALDIEVGNLAAIRLHPRNFDAIEKKIMEDAAALRSDAPKEKPPQPRMRSGNGLTLGGRGWNL